MKLSDMRMRILAAAAEQHDRLVKPPGIPPGPRGALEAKLPRAGMREQVRLEASEYSAIAGRHADGKAVG